MGAPTPLSALAPRAHGAKAEVIHRRLFTSEGGSILSTSCVSRICRQGCRRSQLAHYLLKDRIGFLNPQALISPSPPKMDKPAERSLQPLGRFDFFRCVYAGVWLDAGAEEGGVCRFGRLGSSERADPQAVSLIAREPCDCGERWNPAVTRVHGSVNQVASSSGSRGWAIV